MVDIVFIFHFYFYYFAVPNISCALFVAHLTLHSGIHSILLFCSIPLGLVQSYKHLPKHPSNSGSFFVPLIDGSTLSLAYAAWGGSTTICDNTNMEEEERKVCRNVPRLTIGDDVVEAVVEEEIMEADDANDDGGNVVNRGVNIDVWTDVIVFLLGVVE